MIFPKPSKTGMPAPSGNLWKADTKVTQIGVEGVFPGSVTSRCRMVVLYQVSKPMAAHEGGRASRHSDFGSEYCDMGGAAVPSLLKGGFGWLEASDAMGSLRPSDAAWQCPNSIQLEWRERP